MRDVDDADAARGDLAHDLEQPFDFGRGQRRGRLVHDEDARGIGQRLGDGDDLAPADRQFADRLIDVDVDADGLEPLRAARRIAARSSTPARVSSRPRKRLAVTSRPGTRSSSWKIVATPAACAARGSAKRTGAVDQHLAGVRLDHAREHVHQRRLAGAVLAEQRMDLAAVEIEVDAAQRLDAAETLDDPAHGEQRRGRVQRRLARKRAHPQIGWRGGAATPAAGPRRIRRFFLLRDDAPSETKSVPAASALSATSSPISAFAP